MTYYTEEASQALRERFETEVRSWPDVTTRPMFGCPSYQVRGRLFAFLVDEGVVLTQLNKIDREALNRRTTTSEFKAGERVIQHWITAHIDNQRELSYLIPYVRKSYEVALERALDT